MVSQILACPEKGREADSVLLCAVCQSKSSYLALDFGKEQKTSILVQILKKSKFKQNSNLKKKSNFEKNRNVLFS